MMTYSVRKSYNELISWIELYFNPNKCQIRHDPFTNNPDGCTEFRVIRTETNTELYRVMNLEYPVIYITLAGVYTVKFELRKKDLFDVLAINVSIIDLRQNTDKYYTLFDGNFCKTSFKIAIKEILSRIVE